MNFENNSKKPHLLNEEEAIGKLCQLAASYRGYRTSPEKQVIVVNEYMKLFNQLYTDGMLPILDFECLLPDEFLPEEYVGSLGLSSESAYRRI